MPTLIELEQLLDIALTSPDVGTVNFNILRVFLHEILQHLNIGNKIIDIDAIASELKSAYDFIKDGYVELEQFRSTTPTRPNTELARRPQGESTVRPQTEPAKGQTEHEGHREIESTVRPQTEPAEGQTEQEGHRETEQGEQEQPQVMVVESKPSETQVVPERIFSPSKLSPGLSVKEFSGPSRSTVMLLGRSDSLKDLQKRVSELQERVEFLESQTAINTPDPVRSVASLVRKESKTPAHDFVELINIKRKVEASENSLEGLTEMVDALTSDVNELKENLRIEPAKESLDAMRSDIEDLRKSLNAAKGDNDKQVESELRNLEAGKARMDEIENMLGNIKEDMAELTKQKATPVYAEEAGTDLLPTVSEALQAVDTHKEQLQVLETQIDEIKGQLTEADEKASEMGQAASDALASLEVCKVRFNDIEDKLAVFEKELKNERSLIEDNEMQIHQMKNTWLLMKRDSLERTNEEAERKQEEDKAVVEVEIPAPRRPSHSVDRDELSLIRSMIFDLQEEKDKLRETDVRLSDELYKKQRHLDELYNLVDELRDVKADKELLSVGFDLKADKREVDAKIGREDFEHYMSLVDQSLRDLLQRLDGHEDALKRTLEGVNLDVGRKLDKDEVEPLKHYLEARIQSMKPKPVEKPPPEESAAGIRRQFLVNHNCISCDRPVQYAKEEAFPPLPTIHSLPGSKSNRPYTTFELEQIRQHMLRGGLSVGKERFELLERQRTKLQKEILRLSGARNLQELAEVTARACGGIHTLTYPHSQAVVRGLQLNGELDFLVPQKDFEPVDILGQDGHIYKGLLDTLPPTLPRIKQKSKSRGMKTPPQNLRRSTSPTSPNVQKSAADEVESA